MASGNPAPRFSTKLCIAADGAAVATLVRAAHAFADAAGLAPVPAARLAIVTEELVSNLIDHADLGTGAGIEFGLCIEAGRVRLTLVDPGVPFDPRTAPAKPTTARGGNAGLALVTAWAIIEDYRREGSSNILSLSLSAG